ncbi:hypothetical protein CWI84_11285 [Idiomarina tyrosinivorans]|uniref:DUF2970 domain-containing protein n=1 Tax=Idiomarina tyrosinivorans TaxID=1445662 RepID=A0A432ZF36_9GAMM|nr:DUF2970 domain-containing protein [Idiomarina tyrosinivorans]RUO76576.1 hypothetical protein CWI84_11285 [Idiomarina tyrosinivorans]
MTESSQQSPQKPSLLDVFFSVVAAFFGVQSQRNRVRDFSQGSPLPYIIVGVIMAAILVGGLILLVNIILANSQLN